MERIDEAICGRCNMRRLGLVDWILSPKLCRSETKELREYWLSISKCPFALEHLMKENADVEQGNMPKMSPQTNAISA